jgi:hypothetical protein
MEEPQTMACFGENFFPEVYITFLRNVHILLVAVVQGYYNSDYVWGDSPMIELENIVKPEVYNKLILSGTWIQYRSYVAGS